MHHARDSLQHRPGSSSNECRQAKSQERKPTVACLKGRHKTQTPPAERVFLRPAATSQTQRHTTRSTCRGSPRIRKTALDRCHAARLTSFYLSAGWRGSKDKQHIHTHQRQAGATLKRRCYGPANFWNSRRCFVPRWC
ncbi:unnamed protein product, partial [Ectocarpus sp. 4 AP-2014]